MSQQQRARVQEQESEKEIEQENEREQEKEIEQEKKTEQEQAPSTQRFLSQQTEPPCQAEKGRSDANHLLEPFSCCDVALFYVSSHRVAHSQQNHGLVVLPSASGQQLQHVLSCLLVDRCFLDLIERAEL